MPAGSQRSTLTAPTCLHTARRRVADEPTSDSVGQDVDVRRLLKTRGIGMSLVIYTVMYVLAVPVLGAFGFHVFWEQIGVAAVVGIVSYAVLRLVQHHPAESNKHT